MFSRISICYDTLAGAVRFLSLKVKREHKFHIVK